MSKRKVPGVQEDVQCNLIPMIDIMFLLLLFFMLSADMGQREFAEVVLPKADQVKEVDKSKGQDEYLAILNIFHRPESADFACPLYAHGATCREPSHWLISLRGKEYTRDTIRDQLKIEADEALEETIDKDAGKQLSKRMVTIRADRTAPYGDVQHLIELCGDVGIYKIEVAAAAPTPP
jgi:biopolymer transport protein ExbD